VIFSLKAAPLPSLRICKFGAPPLLIPFSGTSPRAYRRN
jgi:hypothetical protein